jgi:L-amino acid N-acyltransferase YncA
MLNCFTAAIKILHKLSDKLLSEMKNIVVKNMSDDNWNSVQEIYKSGIETKNATFEKNAPEWESWDSLHRKDCRLIVEFDKRVNGWAALSNVSERCVYSGVAEVSIYIDPEFQGKGIGNILMQSLITESEKNKIWTLQAGIFPENEGSLHLHQKFGFRIIGRREKIGKMDEHWRDVIMLERRSKITGI